MTIAEAGAIIGEVRLSKHQEAVRIVLPPRRWRWPWTSEARAQLPNGLNFLVAELPLAIACLQEAEREAYKRGLLGWPRGLRDPVEVADDWAATRDPGTYEELLRRYDVLAAA